MAPQPQSDTVTGTGVVAGIAYAPLAWVTRAVAEVSTEPDAELVGEGAHAERDKEMQRLEAASSAVAERLAQRSSAATGVAAEVLGANAQLARDKGWLREAKKHVSAGVRAEGAARRATEKFVGMFAKLGGRQAERISDLEDICGRIIAELRGEPEPGLPALSSPAVLAAEDLAPADTAGLDPQYVHAIVTELGGPTSHTSIIARQLGIPCIVAATGLSRIAEATPVLVDASSGTITPNPDPESARSAATADADLRTAAAAWQGPARLADGHAVDLLANVQDGSSARAAAEGPAEGIGLFRTELAFLDQKEEPSVAEQAELYGEVLSAFAHRKVVIRTLDAGSDKPLTFASLPDEENPALGVRGLRIDRLGKGLLDRQLDAISLAAQRANVGTPWVMAPMVALPDEAEDFVARCRQRQLKAGIMIEIPAAALLIDRMLPIVDFVSIGTNDLTQYTMAADRMSPKLAELTNPWQPAVLALINRVTTAASDLNKETGKTVPVGVCGEAAADPELAAVMVGMGVNSLSAAASAVPFVGARLSELTMEQCAVAARAALAASSATAARSAAKQALQG